VIDESGYDSEVRVGKVRYDDHLARIENRVKAFTWLFGAALFAAVVWVGIIDDNVQQITDEEFVGMTVFTIDEMPAQVAAGGDVTFTRNYCNIFDGDLSAIGDVGLIGDHFIPIEQGFVLVFPKGGSGCSNPTIDPEVFPFTLPMNIPPGIYAFRFDIVIQDPQSSRTQPKTAITNVFEVVP